jgi:uncharacterized protein YcaQ
MVTFHYRYSPGDTFIARMDAKADRKTKVLIVHNIHFEPVDISETIIEKLMRALNAFVRFNQCDDIVFKKSNNDAYLESIRSST